MLRILCVCGNGMGTSTILKIKVKNISEKIGIDVTVESCSAGEAMVYSFNSDIIITTPEWGNMFIVPPQAMLVTMINLMDDNLIAEKLEEAVRQRFPQELAKR